MFKALDHKFTQQQMAEIKKGATLVDDGNVIITELMLNFESCSTRKLNFGKINPTTLSFSPHVPWKLAIGCKGGLLYICDIRGIKILFSYNNIFIS